MDQPRPFAVHALGFLALLLLLWMLVEQDKVSQCNEFLSHKTRSVNELSEYSTRISSDVILSKTPSSSDRNDTGFIYKWDYNWDKREPKPGEEQPVERRILVLVRHGKHDFGTGNLTKLGRSQANLTGLRLKEMNLPYSEIVHSSMIRAQETAKIISYHLPNLRVSEDDTIRGGGPRKPSTSSYTELLNKDGPRLEAAFLKYFFRADQSQAETTALILVAHGNIFKYFVPRALQLEPSAWMRVFIAHASISVLECNRDSTVIMTKFGDAGHLPVSMVTYLD